MEKCQKRIQRLEAGDDFLGDLVRKLKPKFVMKSLVPASRLPGFEARGSIERPRLLWRGAVDAAGRIT